MNLDIGKNHHTLLPCLWIRDFFEKTSNIKKSDIPYYRIYFKHIIDIGSQCSFKLPRKNKFEGHPFYYESLKTIQKLTLQLPASINELLSTPIWYNKFFNTKFDCNISQAGYNLIKDIVFQGELVNMHDLRISPLSVNKKKTLIKIGQNMPENLKSLLKENHLIFSVPYPRTVIQNHDSFSFLKSSNSNILYNSLIQRKVKLPVGMHRWTLKLNLSDARIINAFTFPQECTLSMKSRNLQYKISTFTLPTSEYLWNYKVRDNYYCTRCLSDPTITTLHRDNISHALFTCPKIEPFIDKVFTFFTDECKVIPYISETDYLLGFMDKRKQGINSALIECKKFLFYSFSDQINIDIQVEMYKTRLRRIILLEKKYFSKLNKMNQFFDKWQDFSPVYMSYGPDPLL